MTDIPGFRPLYQQVREMFLRRISDRTWPPGRLLPSEQMLAVELGVSQGTVRKALDSLAADNLLERRQGKGTYVAAVTPERSLFQFFRMARPGGERLTPSSGPAKTRVRAATDEDRRRLDLEPDAEVIEIERARIVDDSPIILETIVVARDRFPGLENGDIPNALYAQYQSAYGVSVTAANEELRAHAATADEAALIGVAEGTPLLSIDRLAYDLDGKPVEWRRSLCDTRELVYAVTLR